MTLFLATFARVFLLAFQTRNVVGDHYLMAGLTSVLIAVTDVAIVLLIVGTGWGALPYVAAGGAAGVTAAMWAHRRWVR